MIIGGWNGSTIYDVEIVELSQSGQQCQKPQDNSYSDKGMVGGFINGRPLVCGGSFKHRCSEYSFTNEEWTLTTFSMKEERALAASVILPNGTFFIIGGSYGTNLLTTTELLIEDAHFEYGVDLPDELSQHCAVLINSSHLVTAGGYYTLSSYLLDINLGVWTRIEDMNKERWLHSCGLVGGNEVVAAGGVNGVGLDSTEILNIATMTWRTGE